MNLREMFKYDSPQHNKIRKALIARYEMSRTDMTERHTAWERAEEDFRGYTPESKEDARRKAARGVGKHEYTTITVPMTYAMAMTAHTYLSSIFLNRSPVMQVETRKGDAEHGAQAIEALLDYQIHTGKILIHQYVWLLDSLKYGIGIMATYWDREVRRVARLVQKSNIDPETGLAVPDRESIEKETTEVPGYRGNRAYNVRPYDWYPDTRVAIADFQKGEFCGDVTYTSYQRILSDDSYFNLDRLREMQKNGDNSTQENYGSSQIQLPSRIQDSRDMDELTDHGTLPVLRICVNLIPNQWGLGKEEQPEKWIFEVAQPSKNEGVIIAVEPFGHLHDQYAYDLLSYEVEGYALNIRGMMEIGQDINSAISWSYNSHMFNVRKALNDQLIADPSRVVFKDLTDGGPGKIIRLRPQAYGQDIRSAVGQLQMHDVTGQNVNDMRTLSDIMQQVLGVNDNVMGQVNPGGRKTATEVRTAGTFSISRLKNVAEYYSAIGFAPLAFKMISNTQQFYFADEESQKDMFRIVGELAEGFKTIEVTPEALAGQFDFIPVDGTMPIDRVAQANTWKELMLGMMQTDIQANYEEMFNWIASLTGVRSLKRFKIQAMPDQQVAQQRQAGNLVPRGT